MAYIYAADLFCDECGKAICDRLTTAGQRPENPEDDRTFDSGDYPKSVGEVGESDSVDHCASGETCLNAETIGDRKVGSWLGNDLTDDGLKGLNEQIIDPENFNNPIIHQWRTWYRDYCDLEPLPIDLVADGASWDRFDICEAYAVLEWDWNLGGWLHERPSNVRRGKARGYIGEATSIQLARMKFQARPSLSYATLSDNAKAIYWIAAINFGLVKPA